MRVVSVVQFERKDCPSQYPGEKGNDPVCGTLGRDDPLPFDGVNTGRTEREQGAREPLLAAVGGPEKNRFSKGDLVYCKSLHLSKAHHSLHAGFAPT